MELVSGGISFPDYNCHSC